jgi:hypothetical protein
MRIPVTYKGQEFIAVADGAGLDVECVADPTPDIMTIGTELWNLIFETRLKIFGADVEEYDTTYGELQASLDELNLR